MSEDGSLSPKVEAIIESISGLTVLELADLVKALEEKFGVSAAAPMMMAGMAPAGGAGEAVVEEQTEFDVVLNGPGEKKIQVIKVVRQITSLGLKEAKALVDEAPKAVKEGVTKQEAEEILAQLSEAGALAEIR